MPRRTTIAAAATAAAALALAGTAGSARADRPCTGAMLAATFKAIRGSAGAGNISYRLAVHNSSKQACFVTGLPTVTLLDSRGKALPTKTSFAGRPGILAAVMVPLKPGGAASLKARFSPDVPGPGEPVTGVCERTAYTLRVAPSGGGSTLAPITPPTAVCEHGSMSLTSFVG
jgi:Domain of unknown function (DUF4232)